MAFTGSTEGYMEDQEFGGTKSKGGKKGVPIPTSYASGEGENAQPRRRLPRKPNTLRNIRLQGNKKKRIPKHDNQALLFKVQDAVESGKRMIYHDFGGRDGILRVLGGRKGFKRGWPKGAQLKMVHDMTEDSVAIPSKPWLAPAVVKTEKFIFNIYSDSLIFQLKKHNLFQDR
jgi:hypothetical protein